MSNTVYIGLGSNLADPIAQLTMAFSALQQLPNTLLTNRSSMYGSQPLGPQDQPDYVNAVVELQTTLSPQALLQQLQQIEAQAGRERKAERWGPRTLDLDILLYNDHVMQTAQLTIPHYDMTNREFVMIPLVEIAPTLQLPNGDYAADIAKKLSKNGLHKLAI